MFCGKCGKQIADDVQFCNYCGASAKSFYPPGAQKPEETEPGADSDTSNNQTAPPPYSNPVVPKTPPAVKQKDYKIVDVPIVCVFLVILVAGTGAFLYFTGRLDGLLSRIDKPQAEETQQSSELVIESTVAQTTEAALAVVADTSTTAPGSVPIETQTTFARQPTAIDLMQYMWQPVSSVKPLFANITETQELVDGWPYIVLRNNAIELKAYSVSERISAMTIYSKGKYSFLNFSIGANMQQSAAALIATDYGYVIISNKPSEIRIVDFEGNSITLESMDGTTISYITVDFPFYYNPFVGKAVTTADVGLFLRKGPGLDYDDIDLIPYNSTVEVLRFLGDWTYVQYNGKQGCVATRYITVTETY